MEITITEVNEYTALGYRTEYKYEGANEYGSSVCLNLKTDLGVTCGDKVEITFRIIKEKQ